jgi:hypothetical protein
MNVAILHGNVPHGSLEEAHAILHAIAIGNICRLSES